MEPTIGDEDLDDLALTEELLHGTVESDDVQDARRRPEYCLQRKPQCAFWGRIELPVAPANLHVLGVRDISMLGPDAFRNVGSPDCDACVPSVIDDIYRLDQFSRRGRIEPLNGSGAARRDSAEYHQPDEGNLSGDFASLHAIGLTPPKRPRSDACVRADAGRTCATSASLRVGAG